MLRGVESAQGIWVMGRSVPMRVTLEMRCFAFTKRGRSEPASPYNSKAGGDQLAEGLIAIDAYCEMPATLRCL